MRNIIIVHVIPVNDATSLREPDLDVLGRLIIDAVRCCKDVSWPY
jgi:hypothetical protein